MVQKSQTSNIGITNNTINKSIENHDLISLRNKLHPVISFNTQSLLLLGCSFLLLSFVLLRTSNLNFNAFFILVTIDLIFSSLLIKPFKYHKGGFEVKTSNDLQKFLNNVNLSEQEALNYLKFFIPRLIVYSLMLFTSIRTIIQNNEIAIQDIIYYFWVTVVFIMLMIFLVSIAMVGTGLLIDDYLNEGASHRAWKNFRHEVSNSALELDKLISKINNSQTTVINQEHRQKLAGTLFKLRNFLVIENQPDPTYTPDMKIRFTNAEREISQELRENLKKDKCVVCYSQLANSTGPYLVCPICGQGGHKEHIEEWFQSKTACPGCSSDLLSSSYLLLT